MFAIGYQVPLFMQTSLIFLIRNWQLLNKSLNFGVDVHYLQQRYFIDMKQWIEFLYKFEHWNWWKFERQAQETTLLINLF